MELYVLPRFWRPDPSADHDDDEAVRRAREVLTSSIASFLDPDRLRALAEDLGCVARNRKHHAGLMVIATILSALRHGPDTEGRWLDAQSLYERLGGRRGGPTAFRDKLRDLEPVFRELLGRRVRSLQTNTPQLRGRLSAFADVLIPDGCAFKIAAALAGMWPGTGTPAEFKLHAVYSVRAGGLADAKTSAGSVHDTVGFQPDRWVREALYLWDLGYQDYNRFVDAVLSGAIPLQRLKDKTNPIVLAWYDEAGTRHSLRGADGRAMRLDEACAFEHLPAGGPLDLDVEIGDDRGRKVTARVVCVPFEGKDRWYLTTLPRAVFSPHDVAEIYRVRWEVELFFRDLKGAVRLDEVTRLKNPISLRVALLASLIAATLGQELTAALHAPPEPERESEDESESTTSPPPLPRTMDGGRHLKSEEPGASQPGFPPSASPESVASERPERPAESRPTATPREPSPPKSPAVETPPARRTRLAVTLQLGRGVEDLVVLVREGARTLAGRQAASRMAAGIVRGARDRSREQQPAVEDQQRRATPMTEARAPTRRGKTRPDSGRSRNQRAA